MRPPVRELDKPLGVVVLALSVYGLATLYSAGQTDIPSFVTTLWHKQLIWLAVGLVGAVLMFRTSPRLLEWATPYAYGITVLVLLFTLFIGTGGGTAASERSWITIAGVRIGQPAELAKLAVVLMLARWLAERREAPATLRDLLPACVIAGVPTLLVAKQPDLGSAMVFIAILFAMLFWAGTKPSLLVLLGSPVIGLILAFSTVTWGAWIVVLVALLVWWRPYVWEGLAVMLANLVMGVIAVPFWQRLAPYQQNRLLAFLNPQEDPRATGWHVIQSKIAIGSGGFLGQGFLHGPQKRLAFLPAQFTDFIFSVVGEELGFLGVLVALGLFAALLLILLRIARRATDPYSSLCVFGVTGILFTHIIENVGMTVNLLPITGIPLPFFSYGGSFLLTCFLATGISLRVAWEARQSGYAEL
ncbi:MAG TPA: rod shape-determining protein RodA [Gemmatimonadales bacterium]|nr:rod shape-determining protein RodA [Gemmatimonadales bacterium]